ncbi:30S ribosomal protein S12 methylthiotransferase RimO [Desulfosporosinus nitroreducens]|uniref:Ribosomal protein uS12 methylthiotransferase RimO n=1 Tax=Desulfosporosinus nitroreducens TaxID=2018668 RepID=A0ABT8QJU2_9FIRM|nr:30S ribosomal protein S12 methylthiotransferase RimO [Desulfosporosinus nitroreducens]MCO1600501.1 30S ribosomal protein S12 methylthiotransferase RimO [Desulfosporosinus nitroreducens]MDO0821588.1 30S ribosomal protein S12 methylthiotransferase RimO [Desulfosporosinus nitroreducens]
MTKKVAVVTLGCPKNQVDSEVMSGLLAQNHIFIENPEEADVIIVNTCTFIQSAKEESIEAIFEMASLKKTGACQTLIATGCLAQRYGSELMQDIPELDGVLGTGNIDEITKLVQETEKKRTSLIKQGAPDFLHNELMARIRSTPDYLAYVKVAEGCDNYCTYCVIPYVRGHFRSRPQESVIHEVQEMAAQGVKEILIMGQDTTRYGQDLYEELRLPQLIRELARIEGIEWIRLMYCYPERFTDELIETMRQEPKVCKYIDLPLQHADNKILKDMNRRGTIEQAETLIGKLRTAMPDITIRTTMITGFPGETEQEFQSIVDFIQRVQFDRLGVFAYSQEENTPAGQREDQVPPEVREKRRDQIMQIQQDISRQRQQRWVNRVVTVLLEMKLPDGRWMGRTEGDAPEIDGQVYIPDTLISLQEGDLVKVRILEADNYDLMGVVVS